MIESQTVALEHGSATVVSEGPRDAPRVVVVPPLGMPAGVDAPFYRALCARLRVCVVELPGAGHASEAHATTGTRELAASLGTVMRALGPGRSHLFGISLGGMIAQWAAIDAPSAIDRLVLASTAARGRDVALSDPLEKLGLALRLFGGGPPRVAVAEAVAGDEVRADPVEARRIARQIEAVPRPSAELLWLAGAVARHDTSAHLAEIRARTLVMTGGKDELVSRALQDELATAIEGAEGALVADAGHALTLDQPEECARLVEAFLLRP